MWQEIAVLIIGLIAVFYVGKKIYNSFTSPTGKEHPCGGCPGCARKEKTRDR